MQVPLPLVTIFASATLSAVASYLTSRISQRRQRSIDRYTFRMAILAEVRALHNHLLEYETAFETRVMTCQLSGAQVLRVLLQTDDTVVFHSSASSIGLFDRRTALRVLRFYADVRILQGRALVLSEAAEAANTSLVKTEMQRHLQLARQTRRRAHALIRRLRREQASMPPFVNGLRRRLFRLMRGPGAQRL